jgi:hypothetical protein
MMCRVSLTQDFFMLLRLARDLVFGFDLDHVMGLPAPSS